MKQKILVTGWAGFIWSNFCNINKEKYEIIAIDNLFLWDEKNLEKWVKFIKWNACNVEDLNKVWKVDFVVHLAWTSSAPMFMDDWFVDWYVNSIKSFCTTIEWARKNWAKKVLYASTSSLYWNNPMPLIETQNVTPPNHYAVTKWMYEDCGRCYNKVYPEMDIIWFRFMSVYWPNEEAKWKYANIISQFAWDMARKKAPVIFWDWTQFRDFTNVADVVQWITKAIEYKEKLWADAFNIWTWNSCSLNEIVDALNKAFWKEIKAEYIPNPVKEWYVQGQHADISKIENILWYKPTIKLEDWIKTQVKNLRMERIRETSSDDFR